MHDQTVRFKDVGIYYMLYENKNKETLVLLHPYTSSISVFDNQIIALKKDYQLLLVDLPGHGRSGVSRNVSIKDMPEIIKVILDLHSIEDAHFLGIEIGSLVAQAFGQVYPEKIKSLISIGGFSIFHDSYKAINNELLKTKFLRAFKWAFLFNAYKAYYLNNACIKDDAKKKFELSQKNFKRKGLLSKRGISRYYKLGKQKKAYPVYVICGEYELEVIKDACIQFEQKVPKALLEGFQRAKTVVHLDQQRLFSERVITFLKTL